MSAIQLNFSIENGSYFQTVFTYRDTSGNNIDLSNYGIYLRFRTNQSVTYSFSNCETQADYRLSGDSNGNITLKIPAKTTQNYNFQSAVYDLEIQEPNEIFEGSGFTYSRIYYGTITILQKNVPTPVPLNLCNTDLGCYNCCDSSILDTNSVVYSGSGFDIYGLSQNVSSISINDDRIIESLKVKINGLNHNYPQNLIMVLTNLDILEDTAILLSAHNKIINYQSNFTFVFSDDAESGSSLNNVKNFGICKILDKTEYVTIGGLSLSPLLNTNFAASSAQGTWTLTIIDTDIDNRTEDEYSESIVGDIDSWELIIKYEEDNIEAQSILIS